MIYKLTHKIMLTSLISALLIHTPGIAIADNLNNFFGLDSDLPFGTLSKNQMPIFLLKNQAIYSTQPITLGGQIEPDLQSFNGSYTQENYHQGSNISLSHTYLFTMVNFNSWAKGIVTYTSTGYGSPSMDRSFLLLGDLSKNPFYATAGYAYLPFGVFSGNGPLNNTLSTNLFRVANTNQVSLNYDDYGLMINTAVFQNKNFHHLTSDFLVNGLYTYDLSHLANLNTPISASLGAGYLNDFRGANSTLGQSFSSTTPSASQPFTADKRLGVYDLNAGLNYGPFGLLAELDSTINSVNTAQGSINHLSTYDIAGSYSFKIHQKPIKAVLSYSQTHNMSLVSMPLFGNYDSKIKSSTGMKSSWLGSLQYEPIKNIYLGPELAYSTMYNQTHTWTGTMDLTAYF